MCKVSVLFSAALLALTSLCEPVVFAPKPYVDSKYEAATNFAAAVADKASKDAVDEVKALGYATSDSANELSKSYADSATNAVISYVEGKGYVTTNDLASVAASGDYNDLSNKPSIPIVPSDISGFSNDAGYVTGSVTNGLASKSDLTNATNELAKAIPAVPHVPTNVSELTNDSGYITHEEDGTFLAWKTNQILVAGESASAHSNPDYGSVALGKGANAKGSYSVAVGNGAKATMSYTTAVGNSTEATGFWSVAYGGSSEATYKYATAVGYQAHGVGENAVAVGHSSRATMDSVAVGNAAQSSVKYGIAIGSGAQTAGDYGIAIGYKSYALKSCFSIPFGPESFYLSSSATNSGQTAKNLKSYLDEKASVALLSSYSNELSSAISNARPDDYENVSNKAANAASRGELTSATNALATSIEKEIDAKGYLTAESDPDFVAYTNGASVALSKGARAAGAESLALGRGSAANGYYSIAAGNSAKSGGFRSSALGTQSEANGARSTALGYLAYAKFDDTVAIPFDASHFYLNSSTSDKGASGYTLQSMFDTVTSNITDNVMPQIEMRSKRYVIETLDSSDVVAEDAHIYSITAGTNGFTVATPDVNATYSQDFVIRVHVADANGTQIARLEDYLYDFPSGDLTKTASIAEDGYVTFRQVTKGRWLVCWIPAKPKEED